MSSLYTEMVWVPVCRNTAFVTFVHITLTVLSSAHSSKRQIIHFSLLRVISISWSLSCAYNVGGEVSHAKERSQGVVPRPLWYVINGLPDCRVLERSVHRCPSFSSLTLVLFRLAACQPHLLTTQRWEKHLVSPEAKWNREISLLRSQSQLHGDPLETTSC